MKDIDDITGDILNLSLRLHRELGPGLLESVYETVLADMLKGVGHQIERQFPVDIEFEGRTFGAAEKLNKAHAKQLQTYLRLTKQPVELLINFGGGTLKEGVKRIVNDYKPSASSRLRVNQKK